MLEALLKRVDGLEARLKEKKAEPETPVADKASPNAPDGSTAAHTASNATAGGNGDAGAEIRNPSVFSTPKPPYVLLGIYALPG